MSNFIKCDLCKKKFEEYTKDYYKCFCGVLSNYNGDETLKIYICLKCYVNLDFLKFKKINKENHNKKIYLS